MIMFVDGLIYRISDERGTMSLSVSFNPMQALSWIGIDETRDWNAERILLILRQ
jgi:hypothetical protein